MTLIIYFFIYEKCFLHKQYTNKNSLSKANNEKYKLSVQWRILMIKQQVSQYTGWMTGNALSIKTTNKTQFRTSYSTVQEGLGRKKCLKLISWWFKMNYIYTKINVIPLNKMI